MPPWLRTFWLEILPIGTKILLITLSILLKGLKFCKSPLSKRRMGHMFMHLCSSPSDDVLRWVTIGYRTPTSKNGTTCIQSPSLLCLLLESSCRLWLKILSGFCLFSFIVYFWETLMCMMMYLEMLRYWCYLVLLYESAATGL